MSSLIFYGKPRCSFRLGGTGLRGIDPRVDKEIPCLENRGSRHGWAGSLSDLKEIGCKSVWLVHISHPVTFFLRFFKSDRLPGQRISSGMIRSSIQPSRFQICWVDWYWRGTHIPPQLTPSLTGSQLSDRSPLHVSGQTIPLGHPAQACFCLRARLPHRCPRS